MTEVADAARDTQVKAGNMIAHDITAHVKSLTQAPGLESAMLKLGVRKVDPKKKN